MNKHLLHFLTIVFFSLQLFPISNPNDIYKLTDKDEILNALNETGIFLIKREYTKDKEMNALQNIQERYYKIRIAYLAGLLWKHYKKSQELIDYISRRWEYSSDIYGLKIEDEIIEFTKLYPNKKEIIQTGWYYKYYSDIQQSYRNPSTAYNAVMSYLEKYPDDKKASKLVERAYYFLSREKELQSKLLKLGNEKFPNSKELKKINDRIQMGKSRKEAVGKKFELEFTDIISKKNISFVNNKEKIIVIDFWATWCGPCVAELPKLKNLYNKYKNKNVLFIGINLDEDKYKVINFCKKNQIEWPQYYDGKAWKSEIVKKWAIRGIPTLFVLDKDNIIYSTEARRNLDKIIDELINKYKK